MVSAAFPISISLLLAGVWSAAPGINNEGGNFGNWNPSGGNGGGGGGNRGVDYDNSGSWSNNNPNNNDNNRNNGGNYRRTIEIATYDYDDGYNGQRPYGYRRHHHHHSNRGGYGLPQNQFDQQGGNGGRSSYGYQGRRPSQSNYGRPQNQFDYNDYQDPVPNQRYGPPPRKSSYGYQGPVQANAMPGPPPVPKKSSYGYQGPPPRSEYTPPTPQKSSYGPPLPQGGGYGRKSSYGYQGAAAAHGSAEVLPSPQLPPPSPPLPSFSQKPNRPLIQTPPSPSSFEPNLSPEQKTQLDTIQREPLLPPLPSTDNAEDSFGSPNGNQRPPSRFNEQSPIPQPDFNIPSFDQNSNGNQRPPSRLNQQPSIPESPAPPPLPPVDSSFNQNPPILPSFPEQKPIPQPQFNIPTPPPPPPIDGSRGGTPEFSIPQPPPPPPPPPMDGAPQTPRFGDAQFSPDVKTEFKIPTPPPPPPPPPMDG